jgi:uncharacterized protein VirK/YbjX
MSAKIYDDKNFSAYRRSLVFVIRSMLHYQKMEKLRNFMEETLLRREIAVKHPAVFEQVTRCIFYRGSTFGERLKLITDHLLVCEQNFTEASLREIYTGQGIMLWQGDYYGEKIFLELCLFDTHYREGMLGLVLKIGGQVVYTVIFWLEHDNNGEPILKIGALQGTREGLRINRDITKCFFGYRPKNFMLFGLRVVAARLGIKRIYAVGDYGHYAKNHIRINRKLKTSLDGFWQETGGQALADRRFYELPLSEARKDIEDVVSHKRNLYRKRYNLLDRIAVDISQMLDLSMKYKRQKKA